MLRATFAFFLLTAAACDPGWGVSGRVVSHPTPPAPGAAGQVTATGKPIAGATVAFECPKDPSFQKSVVTDATGAYHMSALGFVPDGCSLKVSAPGYTARSYGFQEHCTGEIFGSCSEARIDAELDPVTQ